MKTSVADIYIAMMPSESPSLVRLFPDYYLSKACEKMGIVSARTGKTPEWRPQINRL